jgi:hypothetical protein
VKSKIARIQSLCPRSLISGRYISHTPDATFQAEEYKKEELYYSFDEVYVVDVDGYRSEVSEVIIGFTIVIVSKRKRSHLRVRLNLHVKFGDLE